MEKILLFIYDEMIDFEFTLATHLLRTKLNFEIITISYDMQPVISLSGIRYLPDLKIDEAFSIDSKGLIIPGGLCKNIENSIIQLIQKFNNENKLLAAICAAPRLLAISGILEGCNYTTSLDEWTSEVVEIFGEDDPFPRETYQNSRIVKDGNIITAKGHAFVDFAVEILKYLSLENNLQLANELLKDFKEYE